jgi:hypothetical protein
MSIIVWPGTTRIGQGNDRSIKRRVMIAFHVFHPSVVFSVLLIISRASVLYSLDKFSIMQDHLSVQRLRAHSLRGFVFRRRSMDNDRVITSILSQWGHYNEFKNLKSLDCYYWLASPTTVYGMRIATAKLSVHSCKPTSFSFSVHAKNRCPFLNYSKMYWYEKSDHPELHSFTRI